MVNKYKTISENFAHCPLDVHDREPSALCLALAAAAAVAVACGGAGGSFEGEERVRQR